MITTEIKSALGRLGGDQIMKKLSDQKPLDVIRTGIRRLDDEVLGIGGLPRGRVVHLYAHTTVGKSTLAQWFCGVAQKQGGLVSWGDAERTIQKNYASGSGMNLEETFLIEWSSGPDLLYKTRQCIALGIFDVIVLDSLDMIRPIRDAETDPTMHDKMAHPVLLNSFFYDTQAGFTVTDADGEPILNSYTIPAYNDKGKLVQVKDIHRLSDKKTVLIVISHKKANIKTGFMAKFAPKTRTSGGGEKDFVATIQLDLKHKGFKKGKSKGEKILKWREVIVKADKNKVATPQKETVLNIMPDGSIIADDMIIFEVQDMSAEEAQGAGLATPEITEEASIANLTDRLRQFKEGKDTEDDVLPSDQ